MFRVRVGVKYLGRRTTGAPLTAVPEPLAYEFDTRAQAQRLAENHAYRTGEVCAVEEVA